jgi:single-stranded-DNA-specific exonuclease
LAVRGFDDPASASRFLSPRLADLRPPSGIADLSRALDRLVSAIATEETVGVFGDYDVDGVTTAAILTGALRALGLRVIPRVARRAAGYGLSPEDAVRFCDEGCRLILTGDCGTSDGDAIAAARQRGVDVIVIDHHHVPSGESPAYALLNSHRPDDAFPFKGLASCGVAFYLVAALRTRLRGSGHQGAERLDVRELLDLVALGTVADLVPLREENRILAAVGLRELSALRRPGLRALAGLSGIEPGEIGTTEVSFRLAPRLNAAGRLGEAQVALDLLLATDATEGQRLARELDDMNRERQKIQEGIWTEALRAAAEYPDDAALVLGGDGWHQGVVGIVAAKLVDRFRKPAVVVGFNNGVGRGSARSAGGLDLYGALEGCQEHLLVFGGHAAAAGLELRQECLCSFREAFVSAALRHRESQPARLAVEVDAAVELSELDIGQAEELARLAPFGSANPEPTFAIPDVVTRATRIVGSSHLQLTLARGAGVNDAIAFGMADRDPGEGARLDVVGVAEVDTYRGTRRSRLRLKELWRRSA